VNRNPIIEVKNLYVYFYTYAGIVRAIEDVSFTVYHGEKFCIVGETGCGKTVVSRALTRSIPPPGRIIKGEIKYYRNNEVVDIVNAKKQAEIIDKISQFLNEEELAIVKKARNKKFSSHPKNVTMAEYRYATALEALLGHFFLIQDYDTLSRLFELIEESLEVIEN
jgi:23S rRNA maturation mini-RNase III